MTFLVLQTDLGTLVWSYKEVFNDGALFLSTCSILFVVFGVNNLILISNFYSARVKEREVPAADACPDLQPDRSGQRSFKNFIHNREAEKQRRGKSEKERGAGSET